MANQTNLTQMMYVSIKRDQQNNPLVKAKNATEATARIELPDVRVTSNGGIQTDPKLVMYLTGLAMIEHFLLMFTF